MIESCMNRPAYTNGITFGTLSACCNRPYFYTGINKEYDRYNAYNFPDHFFNDNGIIHSKYNFANTFVYTGEGKNDKCNGYSWGMYKHEKEPCQKIGIDA